MKKTLVFFAFFCGIITYDLLAQQQQTRLFLPNKKTEYHTFLEKSGKNDPLNVFKFEDNVIHVSGEDFGYITTKKLYSNFHLTLFFKWGTKKYPPRINEKRDAGVLYHADFYGGDKIWPRCLEFQIQEGDCGDVWMVDSVMIVHRGKQTIPQNWIRGEKSLNAELPNGAWNKVEIRVKDGMFKHFLNDKLVNEGQLINTRKGAILLQSEGAEVYYKDVMIEEL